MATDVYYNGVWLHNVSTREFHQEATYDASGTDQMSQHFRMRFEGIIHIQSALELDDDNMWVGPESMLNPGCRYYTRRLNLRPGEAGEILPHLCAFERPQDACEYFDPSSNCAPWGFFQLFNARAGALDRLGGLKFPECFASAGSVDAWFQYQWPADKRVPLPGDGRFDVIHVPHGALCAGWNGRRPLGTGWRYVGQTDIPTRLPDPAEWPRPCLVRRIRLRDLQTRTEFLDPGDPYDGVAPLDGEVWEYSIKPLESGV